MCIGPWKSEISIFGLFFKLANCFEQMKGYFDMQFPGNYYAPNHPNPNNAPPNFFN